MSSWEGKMQENLTNSVIKKKSKRNTPLGTMVQTKSYSQECGEG